jgi:hemolysin-activating ACP:hemolysin acyltransferase
MEFGQANNLDALFVQLTLLMAKEPLYRDLPVRRLADVYATLKKRQYLMIGDKGRLSGAILWKTLDESSAQDLVVARRLPTAKELSAKGTAKVLTAFIASDPDTLSQLWRQLVRQQKGNTLLFERHYVEQGQATKAFGWVDQKGKVRVLKGEKIVLQ